jgi:hypothetical protein
MPSTITRRPSRSATRGKMPVPWTTCWSGELEYKLADQRMDDGRFHIEQLSAPGSGKPRFGVNHVGRSLSAVLDGLCGVCGKPTGLDRWQFPFGYWLGETYLFIEPALHRGCAKQALRYCPFLRRNGKLPNRVPPEFSFGIALVSAHAPQVEKLYGLTGLPARAEVVIGALLTLPREEVRQLSLEPKLERRLAA